MKVYLETSSIRKNSNRLSMFKNEDFFTSSLTFFELLSGIQENDFLMRKSIIDNLLNSSINIDWRTFKCKMYNAFNRSYYDIDGIVIKKMVEEIVTCSTIQEYYSKKIYIDDNTYYTHESLEDLDKDISNIGKMFSEIGKNEWKELSKEERKKFKQTMRKERMIFPYIQLLSELTLTNIAEDISGYKRPAEEYFNVIQEYDQSLEIYLKYMHLLFLTHEMNGSLCSKNDKMDTLHLIYLREGDAIISEDKIFRDLNNDLQLIKVYNTDEFIDKI